MSARIKSLSREWVELLCLLDAVGEGRSTREVAVALGLSELQAPAVGVALSKVGERGFVQCEEGGAVLTEAGEQLLQRARASVRPQR